MKRTQFQSINGETSLLGVLGYPVSHSLSPVIHNAALEAMNLNWCYLAMPCDPHKISLVLDALRSLSYKGLNITIPHKNTCFRLCNQLSPIAKEVGAINTLIPNNEEGWTGDNTDVEGFLSALSPINQWKNKKAIVLGCGGSAQAVVTALKKLNLSSITMVGRSKESLSKFLFNKTLKYNLGLTSLSGMLNKDRSLKSIIKDASLIVNTTPVGMTKQLEGDQSIEEIPFGKEIWSDLKAGTTLYDLIYTPSTTSWLKLGSQLDCKQINGLEMLVEQGAASLRLWTGIKEIPTTIMHNAAKQYLSK